MSVTTQNATAEGSNRVRVSQQQLIRLRQDARHLSLDALRIRARKGGNYLSHFKGRGMEFDEARLYQDGDDPRSIDWRVTARTGRPYTKLFREERERPVLCWVDQRATMQFATRGVFKSVLAAQLAALLAWAAAKRGDRIGGFVFNDTQRVELRPMLGNRAVLRLIHQMSVLQSDQNAGAGAVDTLQKTMAGLRRVAHPGSLIALMSDFRGLSEKATAHLINIAKHNDVLMLFITDPLEHELPPPGRYPMLLGDRRFNLDSNPRQRERWAAQFEARSDALRMLAERNRIRWQAVQTDDEPLAIMQGLMGRVL